MLTLRINPLLLTPSIFIRTKSYGVNGLTMYVFLSATTYQPE